MTRVIFISMTILVIFSCTETRKEIKTEGGEVLAIQYTPDSRSTDLGIGIGTNGRPIVTTHSTGKQEQFHIVFKCDHGVIFTIEDKELFSTLKAGDRVVIEYREIVNKRDGSVVDFDFVTARKNTPALVSVENTPLERSKSISKAEIDSMIIVTDSLLLVAEKQLKKE